MKALILFALFIPLLAMAQSPSQTVPFTPACIFNGDSFRCLRSQMDINGAASVLTGSDDPSVVAKNAPEGSLYMQTGTGGGRVFVKQDGGNSTNWTALGGGGSVSSVGLSLPSSILLVSGSPVTTSGTLTGSLVSQIANSVWAGPASGANAPPTFRLLGSTDIPNLSAAKITSGQGTLSSGTTGLFISGGTNSLLTNASITIQTASGSQPGLLSAADWTTFNGKQAVGSYITALNGDATAAGPGTAATTVTGIQGTPVSATAPTSGQTLVFNSTSGNWEPSTSSATSPGGATTAVQFNNSGAFGGDAGNFWWDNSGKRLSVGAQPSLIGVAGASSVWGGINTNAFTVGSTTGGTDGAITIKPQVGYVDVIGVRSNLAATQDLHLQGLGNGLFMGGALLKWPNVDGTNGQVLTTNGGALLSWTTPSSGGTPGGSNMQIQYNNSGTFGGVPNFTWNGTGVAFGTQPSLLGTQPPFAVWGTTGANAFFIGSTSGSPNGGIVFKSTASYGEIQGARSDLGTVSTLAIQPESGDVLLGYPPNSNSVTVYGSVNFSKFGEGVAQIDGGGNLSSTAPGTSGNVLTSSGGVWVSAAPSSGITQLTGDVTAGPGSGSQAASVVRIQGVAVSSTTPTTGQVLTYNGTAWAPATPSGGSSSVSSLTAATATNTIDNLNFAQEWDWSTLTTQNGFTHAANALTSGSILNLTSSSTGGLAAGALLLMSQTGAASAAPNINMTNASTSASARGILSSMSGGSGAYSGIESDTSSVTTGASAFLAQVSGASSAAGLSVSIPTSTSSAIGVTVANAGTAGDGYDFTTSNAGWSGTGFSFTNSGTNGTGLAVVGNGTTGNFKGATINLASNNSNSVGVNVTYSNAAPTADAIQVNQGASGSTTNPVGLDIKQHVAGVVSESIFITNNDNTATVVGQGAQLSFGSSDGTSPNNKIAAVQGVLSNVSPFAGDLVFLTSTGAGSVTEHMRLDRFGHRVTKGTAPTVHSAACGTSPGTVSGNDNAGQVTTGSGTTSCQLDFANSWTNIPICMAMDDSNQFAVTVNATTTTLTISSGSNPLGTSVIQYQCMGYL
jgi:hypothetical protein